MKTWYLVSVYIHILCAALWIGGMLFLVLVLLPAIRNNPQRRELLYTTGIKFRLVGWIALILLLTTGLFNMYFRGITLTMLTEGSYNRLFLVKLLLFTVVLLISGIHDFYIGPRGIQLAGTNPNDVKTKRFIRLARIIGELNLLLALVAAALGVVIVRGW